MHQKFELFLNFGRDYFKVWAVIDNIQTVDVSLY